MLSKWRKSIEEEAGIATGTIVLLVAGFAAVAIITTLWIGNTTAGLAADTANCVNRVNSGVDHTCATNNATGAGGGNAVAANNSRPLGVGWLDDFGAGSGLYDIPKMNQADANLERGLLRFEGLKLTVYADSEAALTRLQNATTKAAALSALQELRVILTAAREDGETSTSDHTIQFAANLLSEINHPAAATAQAAQTAAITGLIPLRNAQLKSIEFTDNYNSLTLAQLKAGATSIRDGLAVGRDTFPDAVTKLNEAKSIIASNR